MDLCFVQTLEQLVVGLRPTLWAENGASLQLPRLKERAFNQLIFSRLQGRGSDVAKIAI